MGKITVTTSNLQTTIDLHPTKELTACLFAAILPTLPVFVESFMACMAQGDGDPDFNPGDRPRCKPATTPAS